MWAESFLFYSRYRRVLSSILFLLDTQTHFSAPPLSPHSFSLPLFLYTIYSISHKRTHTYTLSITQTAYSFFSISRLLTPSFLCHFSPSSSSLVWDLTWSCVLAALFFCWDATPIESSPHRVSLLLSHQNHITSHQCCTLYHLLCIRLKDSPLLPYFLSL